MQGLNLSALLCRPFLLLVLVITEIAANYTETSLKWDGLLLYKSTSIKVETTLSQKSSQFTNFYRAYFYGLVCDDGDYRYNR